MGTHVCEQPEFKPGDQPPSGYIAWHEWASIQHKAGLRQSRCGVCSMWRYPQELSEQVIVSDAVDARALRSVKIKDHVCNTCAIAARKEQGK